jgi:multidrug efflux pump subunit AcrB
MLAAVTTAMGVVPLLEDVFWIGRAITTMFGLTFGTILTMVVVPVLYGTLNRLQLPGLGGGHAVDNEGAGQAA